MTMPLCLRCTAHRSARGFRGLCRTCAALPGVRESFPCLRGTPRTPHSFNEQTEAELDAMIAERMRDLPDWWPKSNPHNGEIDRELAKIAAVSVRRGKGIGTKVRR